MATKPTTTFAKNRRTKRVAIANPAPPSNRKANCGVCDAARVPGAYRGAKFPTRDQIEELREQAWAEGDFDGVALIDSALDGSVAAKKKVGEWVSAMRDKALQSNPARRRMANAGARRSRSGHSFMRWIDATITSAKDELQQGDLPASFRPILNRAIDGLEMAKTVRYAGSEDDSPVFATNVLVSLAGIAAYSPDGDKQAALGAIDTITRNFIQPQLNGKPPVVGVY